MASMMELARELGTDAKSLEMTTGVTVVTETQELTPEQEEQTRQAWARSQAGGDVA